MIINSDFLKRLGSLDDLKAQLEEIDQKNLAIDFEKHDFEKIITEFIIGKVKLGGLDNTPETAGALFLLLQKLGKKNNIDYSFNEGINILNQIKTEMNQKNYAELLETFLASDDITPSVSFLQKKATSTSKQSLLPKTEYPPPHEPGHWSEIGIAEGTRSFNPSQKVKSVFEMFSTKYLKELFIWAFPWAVDSSLSSESKKSKTVNEKNLLETEILLPPNIQFETIQCLLLCLDALGKASGKNGELSLKNYDDIKYISDLSRLLSIELTNSSREDIATYEKKVKNYMLKLREKDQALYDHQLHNPAMNNFCHANEKRSAETLHLEYKSSVLIPPSPSSSLVKRKPHFKKPRFPSS